MNNIEEELKKLEELENNEKLLEGQLAKTDLNQELIDLRKKKEQIKKRIENFDIFDVHELGDAIAKVISTYELGDYKSHCFYDSFYFSLATYDDYEKYIGYDFPQFNLNIDNDEKSYFTFVDYHNKNKCRLKPIEEKEESHYIHEFLNYLYNSRYNGCEDGIDTITNNFLEETKDKQKLRHEEKTKARTKLLFERSCQIEEASIFNILKFIINEYDDSIFEALTLVSWNENNPTSNFILIRKSDDKSNKFSVNINKNKIDRISFFDGTYRTEKRDVHYNIDYEDKVFTESHSFKNYSTYYFSKSLSEDDKDNTINFYELKKALPIIEETVYAKRFMDMIEDKFKQGEKVTKDDCHNFLIEVCNSQKEKQKIKRKDS